MGEDIGDIGEYDFEDDPEEKPFTDLGSLTYEETVSYTHLLKELDRVDFFQGAARSYYFLSPSHKFPNDQDTI